jgi:hypothetical protein
MLGGLAENASVLLGFRHLVLVALGFYALSAVVGRWPAGGRIPAAPLPPEEAPEAQMELAGSR